VCNYKKKSPLITHFKENTLQFFVWAKGKKTAQQGVLQGARFTAPRCRKRPRLWCIYHTNLQA